MNDRRNGVGGFIDRAIGLAGCHDILNQIITKEEWQEWFKEHDDTFICHGRVKRIKGEDIAGGMIRLTIGEI